MDRERINICAYKRNESVERQIKTKEWIYNEIDTKKKIERKINTHNRMNDADIKAYRGINIEQINKYEGMNA